MPHVHVTVTGKHTKEWKQDLMDFAAATIPDRTQQAKNAIMTALTDKLGGISRADNCDW